jgi:hypothetical protein
MVTLVLAAVTGWLAWTTRRLARATAEEVQGQTRPVIVPADWTVEVSKFRWFPDATNRSYPQGDDGSYTISFSVRNIGAGPALRITPYTGGLYGDTGYPNEEIPALEPGTAGEVSITVMFKGWSTKGNLASSATPIRIEYRDLAGRLYTTSVGWFAGKWEALGRLNYNLQLSSGGAPPERTRWTPNELSVDPFLPARGRDVTPFDYKRQTAWRILAQVPGDDPSPLWRRLHDAWRVFRRPTTQTVFQRLTLARRVYRWTKEEPVPHRLPSVIRRAYITARALKWAVVTYRAAR